MQIGAPSILTNLRKLARDTVDNRDESWIGDRDMRRTCANNAAVLLVKILIIRRSLARGRVSHSPDTAKPCYGRARNFRKRSHERLVTGEADISCEQNEEESSKLYIRNLRNGANEMFFGVHGERN